MTTDRLNQTLTLKDGRALGFAECGDPLEMPVFYFHASGSSRLERPADESILAELGIRFITTDRPGHGLSDPQPERKLLDWPDDVSQLADHLSVDRFYVMGWSAGGAPALGRQAGAPFRAAQAQARREVWGLICRQDPRASTAALHRPATSAFYSNPPNGTRSSTCATSRPRCSGATAARGSSASTSLASASPAQTSAGCQS